MPRDYASLATDQTYTFIGLAVRRWPAAGMIGATMKPVLIVQNDLADHPAYLGRWLQQRGMPFEVVCSALGRPLPADLSAHGALAVLGGEMSANDDLPALRQAEHLIRLAASTGLPTLGHCLGAQLMSRALGGVVGPSPAPEIGWQPMQVRPAPQSRVWFGAVQAMPVFHWHYESFSLPQGAEWLAQSAACPHQAFALGPHLGMQFHIEIDAAKLDTWSREDGGLYRRAQEQHPRSVQTGPAMRSDATLHLPAHQALADRLYGHWLALAMARAD